MNDDIIHTTPENITGGSNAESVTDNSSEAPSATTTPPITTTALNRSSAFSNDTDSVT